MWMVVLFDLPVDTAEARKEATGFRNYLLDLGFEMSQFSVYARFCSGKERYQTLLGYIERALPKRGAVQVLHFTDKQYEQSVRYSNKGKTDSPKTPGQLALF